MISFGAASGWMTLERMRVEGEHGVGPLDHLPVADVHAVEGADRDVGAGASAFGVWCQRMVDLLMLIGGHSSAQTASATGPVTATEARAGTPRLGRGGRPVRSARSGVSSQRLDPKGADRASGRSSLAVGVAERLDQGPDVGARRALDLEAGALVAVAVDQVGAVDRRPRARASRPPRRGGPCW